jgi:hypothetical protein
MMQRVSTLFLLLLLCLPSTAQERPWQELPPGSVHAWDTLFLPRTLTLSLPLKKAQTRLDSLYYFDYDTLLKQWVKTTSYLFGYDPYGTANEWISRIWSTASSRWVNYQLTLEAYSGNQVITHEEFSWNSILQSWEFYRQYLYERDTAGRLVSTTTQLWDDDLGQWINDTRRVFEYDSASNQLMLLQQDYVEDAWTDIYRNLYTYENNLQAEFIRQDWKTATSSWLNKSRILFSYLPDGRPLIDTHFTWDAVIGWKYITKVLYLWNENGTIQEKLYQTWDVPTSSWKNIVSYLYFQDKNGQDTLIIYRLANASGTSWKDDYKYFYTYDENRNLVKEIWQGWDQVRARWLNDFMAEYYYSGGLRPLIVEVIDSTAVSCFGYADGTATAQAAGGSPPYQYKWNDDQGTTANHVTGLSGRRFFQVTVTDALLSVAVDSVFIPEPEAVITGSINGPTSAETTDTLSYTVDGPVSSLYEWSITGGTLISGQGTTQISVRWDVEGTGKVQVLETRNGCKGDTVYIEVHVVVSGVITPRQSLQAILFPNPAARNGFCTILLNEPWAEHIQINDITGRLVLIRSVHGQKEIVMFLDEFIPGTYLMQLEGKSVAVLRLVIW